MPACLSGFKTKSTCLRCHNLSLFKMSLHNSNYSALKGSHVLPYAWKFSWNLNFTVKTTTMKIKSVKILQFATIGVFVTRVQCKEYDQHYLIRENKPWFGIQ